MLCDLCDGACFLAPVSYLIAQLCPVVILPDLQELGLGARASLKGCPESGIDPADVLRQAMHQSKFGISGLRIV